LRCTYAGGVGATVPENQPSVLGKATQKRTAGKALKREHYGKISSLHVSTCEHSLLDFPGKREIRPRGGPSAAFAKIFQESIASSRIPRAATLSPTKQIPTGGIKSPQKATAAATLLLKKKSENKKSNEK